MSLNSPEGSKFEKLKDILKSDVSKLLSVDVRDLFTSLMSKEEQEKQREDLTTCELVHLKSFIPNYDNLEDTLVFILSYYGDNRNFSKREHRQNLCSKAYVNGIENGLSEENMKALILNILNDTTLTVNLQNIFLGILYTMNYSKEFVNGINSLSVSSYDQTQLLYKGQYVQGAKAIGAKVHEFKVTPNLIEAVARTDISNIQK